MIEMDEMQGVEELPFIFMYPFYLDIKHRMGINRNPAVFSDIRRQLHLVAEFYLLPCSSKFRVVDKGFQATQQIEIGDPGRTNATGNELCQLWINVEEPAARGDAVGFGIEPAGEKFVEPREDPLFQ